MGIEVSEEDIMRILEKDGERRKGGGSHGGTV